MALDSRGPVDARDLDKHRPQLLKYAMLQLRNHAQAEDAVQETMVAAIRGAQGFAGGSSVRTWLIGILKHKIIDSIRKTSREQSLDLDQHESSPGDMTLRGHSGGLGKPGRNAVAAAVLRCAAGVPREPAQSDRPGLRDA